MPCPKKTIANEFNQESSLSRHFQKEPGRSTLLIHVSRNIHQKPVMSEFMDVYVDEAGNNKYFRYLKHRDIIISCGSSSPCNCSMMAKIDLPIIFNNQTVDLCVFIQPNQSHARDQMVHLEGV